MYKKNSEDISEQDFRQHNKQACTYQRPSPNYLQKPTEFAKLVYVASAFSQKRKNDFTHSDTSLFQSVAPGKK